MAQLELKFEAPMQSYGGQTIGNYRPTNKKPTKSSIIGLLASSLGIRRDEHEKLNQLYNDLNVEVNTIQSGRVIRDFQIARYGKKQTELKTVNKFYLADAKFYVTIDGNNELIEKLDYSMKHPVFAPYLGRRSCPPAGAIEIVATYD